MPTPKAIIDGDGKATIKLIRATIERKSKADVEYNLSIQFYFKYTLNQIGRN